MLFGAWAAIIALVAEAEVLAAMFLFGFSGKRATEALAAMRTPFYLSLLLPALVAVGVITYIYRA